MENLIRADNLTGIEGLDHGFGLRDWVPVSGIRTVRQIHSSKVGDAADVNFTEGDALLSDRTGVRVGVKTADCVPVLLVDPVNRVVAAIHAGWRGTAEGIAAKAVEEMVSRWKTYPGNIRAAIGPSIGVCCYEVGIEVANRFAKWLPVQHHLDLRAVNELQLRDAGVENIWQSGECTFCASDRFYSYRREREQAGRMLSFVGYA